MLTGLALYVALAMPTCATANDSLEDLIQKRASELSGR